MTLPSLIAARQGETVLSLHDWLRREHQRGRLVERLRAAAQEAFLIDQASGLGLRVEDAELQQAADLFRRRRQLLSSAQTTAWLEARNLTADDLEAVLERNLILEKLIQHVGRAESVAERFQAQQHDYDRVRLRLILVPREDMAREILSQLAEEGANFVELAKQHSSHPSKNKGGRIGPLFLKHLPPPLYQVLATAPVGLLAEPVATSTGFWIVQVEEHSPAQLDPVTSAAIARELFQEWLRDRLAQAAFSAPMLELLASGAA